MLFAFECGTKMMTQFVIDNGGIMGQFIKAGKVNDVMTNSGISKVMINLYIELRAYMKAVQIILW